MEKKLVTDSVNLYWILKLKDEVNSKTTLKYLNVDDVMIGKTHNIWYSGGAEPYTDNRSCVKAKLACRTYTLQIRVITKLPNSEQSYKGKVKSHKYINRQNQSTTGKGSIKSQ